MFLDHDNKNQVSANFFSYFLELLWEKNNF